MWTLGRISIYPLKSWPGVSVDRAEILPAGNLRHDRELALIDDAGQFMNAKRSAAVHRIRAVWDLANWTVSVGIATPDQPVPVLTTYHLDENRSALADWCSDFFQTRLRLVQRAEGGYPDDLDSPGPTVVSTATLQTVANWFEGLTLDEVRQRFRANLEIADCAPFEEDRLVAIEGNPVPFQIGEATLHGTNPCQRCIVPTRSPVTGESWTGFQRAFARRREAEFPPWGEQSRFDHFYRLTVNTQLSSVQPQAIQVGNIVRLA